VIIAQIVAAVVLGYILGSIPFGVLIARRIARVDVRQYGSGKMGATNVLRTVGKKAAAAVLALDLLKGVLAVIFAGLIVSNSSVLVGGFIVDKPAVQSLAALSAVVGHIFPVFLRFHGGRGVATFLGGLVALCWPAALVGAAVFFIGAALTKYVSLGSIAGAVATYAVLVPLTILNGFSVKFLIYALVGTIIIAVMHRDNVARLLSGKERRLGERVKDTASSTSAEGAE
jgi:glycerol-3-phosphate acyltransferase PlsY